MQTPIVVFQGGLGNQLSQWSYAHTIEGSHSFLVDPIYDTSQVKSRNFELHAVCEKCDHVVKNKNGEFRIPRSRVFYHFLDRLWQFRILRPFVESCGYIREDPRIDQPQTTQVSKVPRYARGYFQKQQNVEKVMGAVQSEIIPLVREILPEVRSRVGLPSEYSVIHVRRGDYAAAEFTPVNIGTLGDQYFIEGLRDLDFSNLVILTENRIDVTDLNFKLKPAFILDRLDTTPWETLAIMYGATKFLGSNSSLSWWGARLCSTRGGDVWLPSQWSYWQNVDVRDYHFPSCRIAKSYWLQGKQAS